MAITPKQQRFVDEYIVDLNATKAAIRAGYSKASAHTQGWDFLQKPEIRSAIEAAAAKRAERVEVKADDLLRRLKEIAFVDVRHAYDDAGNLLNVQQLPDDIGRSLAGIKVFDEFGVDAEGNKLKIGEVRELKFTDRIRALELLGKHLKIFTDRVEHDVSESLAELLASARKPEGKE